MKALMPLGRICEFKYGRSLPHSVRSEGSVPVFGSNGQIGCHDEPATKGPTIIIGRKGSLGEVNFSDHPCWPIDTTYFIDEGATTADLRWLYHLLRTLGLNRLNRSAAVPGLNREDAYRIEVGVPPAEEQRRIAAILDKAEELLAKRRAAIALLDQLPQAMFLEMFGNSTTQPKWPVLKLESFCKTGSGGTPSRQSASRYYEGGTIPWVKSGELRESVIYGTEEHITAEALKESSAKLVPAEAILLAMYGATVGRLAILGIPAATNQAVCNIVPDAKRANLQFVFHALQQQVTSMISMAVGGAQPNISQGLIRSLPIVLPPLDVQKHFADKVTSALKSKEAQQLALNELDALFASLQAASFSRSTSS